MFKCIPRKYDTLQTYQSSASSQAQDRNREKALVKGHVPSTRRLHTCTALDMVIRDLSIKHYSSSTPPNRQHREDRCKQATRAASQSTE
jgi:hypothetical protein